MYDDLEAGYSAGSSTPYGFHNPYRSDNFFDSDLAHAFRTHLHSTLSPRDRLEDIALSTVLTKQKPSDKMLALAASAATEPERIAAMQAVPQLLAEEEVTRQNMQKERERLDREARKQYEENRRRSKRQWEKTKPMMWKVMVAFMVVVGLVGGWFFGMWFVTTPQWKVVEPAAQLAGMVGLLFLLIFLCRRCICTCNSH